MSERTVAVLGLGAFGTFLCEALKQGGAEVLALDSHQDRVDAIKDIADRAFVADTTNADALTAAGVPGADTVVVAIGENTEASIITTLNVQELGAPRVVARAISEVHRRILLKLGVNDVVNPEQQAAARLAAELTAQGIEKLADLGEEYVFVMVRPPEFAIGRNLADLAIRARYELNVVGVHRPRSEASEDGLLVSRPRFILPDAATRFADGDRVSLVGREADIARFLAASE